MSNSTSIFPSLETFKNLSAQGNIIPICLDLTADTETPVSIYTKLKAQKPSFLFESITGGEQISRYSFIGVNPQKTFSIGWEKTTINTPNGAEEIPTPEDPLRVVEEAMASYKSVALHSMPKFTGGVVGFLSYEYIHAVENTVPLSQKDILRTPLLYFILIDTLVIFDHAKQVLKLCVNAFVKEDPEIAYQEAVDKLLDLHKALIKPTSLNIPTAIHSENTPLDPISNFTQAAFEQSVKKAKEYIYAGDITQVVISQRFEHKNTLPPLDLYRTLRRINPSPYQFIFETDDFSLVGASPEVHVSLSNKKVLCRPIAGTRPRGETLEEDHAHEASLLADKKELAEHLMLVDLARNDIGKISTPGSVSVPEYATIERYSHVMHIVSQVEGELKPELNAFDVLRATFPAGTVSGSPKVRAMQIIAELEGTARGPYAGAMGHIGYNGDLDCCIIIRTALLQEGKTIIQSGAGVVADSIPKNEYMETVNKAKGMLKALAISLETETAT
ncbi:MAG: anthranilate synthase component I [Opitutales bacterium]